MLRTAYWLHLVCIQTRSGIIACSKFYYRLYIPACYLSLRSSQNNNQQYINDPNNSAWYFASLSSIEYEFFIIFYHLLIAKLLDTKEGRLIAEFVIPAINKLRLQFSIKFTNMFSYHLLLEYRHPIYILSNDLVSSDTFFDSISFKFVQFHNSDFYLITDGTHK